MRWMCWRNPSALAAAGCVIRTVQPVDGSSAPTPVGYRHDPELRRALRRNTGRSSEKIRRVEDLADVEGSWRGERGERHATIGFPQFFKKSLHDRFGIHADEFLSKD